MNVVPLLSGAVSPAVRTAAEELDKAIGEAIVLGFEGGLPHGIVVSLLQAHLWIATKNMLEDK